MFRLARTLLGSFNASIIGCTGASTLATGGGGGAGGGVGAGLLSSTTGAGFSASLVLAQPATRMAAEARNRTRIDLIVILPMVYFTGLLDRFISRTGPNRAPGYRRSDR